MVSRSVGNVGQCHYSRASIDHLSVRLIGQAILNKKNLSDLAGWEWSVSVDQSVLTSRSFWQEDLLFWENWFEHHAAIQVVWSVRIEFLTNVWGSWPLLNEREQDRILSFPKKIQNESLFHLLAKTSRSIKVVEISLLIACLPVGLLMWFILLIISLSHSRWWSVVEF